MKILKLLIPIAFSLCTAIPAIAGKLQIAPISIDVAAPAATTSINIKNTGKTMMTVQARLFRWSQGKKGEQFHNTRNVVVSPPIVKLRPGKSAVVRIVRISKNPIKSEESYRLIIDELPPKVNTDQSMIRMVMRYSVPVFFGPQSRAKPKTSWKVVQQKGRLVVAAANYGNKRVKLSKMKVIDSRGRSVSFGAGLNGYVLGRSAKNFYKNSSTRLRGSKVTIIANSNFGPLKVTAQLR